VARITWVDQRDDIGRDGFVQITVVDDLVTRAAPETCAIQAKSTASALPTNAEVQVETRHLAFWSDDIAAPTLIALWSRRSQELRIRTQLFIDGGETLTRIELETRTDATVVAAVDRGWGAGGGLVGGAIAANVVSMPAEMDAAAAASDADGAGCRCWPAGRRGRRGAGRAGRRGPQPRRRRRRWTPRPRRPIRAQGPRMGSTPPWMNASTLAPSSKASSCWPSNPALDVLVAWRVQIRGRSGHGDRFGDSAGPRQRLPLPAGARQRGRRHRPRRRRNGCSRAGSGVRLKYIRR
jgi:hypothetical protein